MPETNAQGYGNPRQAGFGAPGQAVSTGARPELFTDMPRSDHDHHPVSTAQELRQALHRASGGETIELAGGDYGQLDLLTFKTSG